MHSGRMVRLLPAGRKNVYMYLDKELVDVDHLCFIETYKMCGVSTLEYFKEFFKAIMQGRTDYEVLKNYKVLFNLDALGGKNYPLRVFSSLDVKIDSLQNENSIF